MLYMRAHMRVVPVQRRLQLPGRTTRAGAWGQPHAADQRMPTWSCEVLYLMRSWGMAALCLGALRTSLDPTDRYTLVCVAVHCY